MNLQEIKQKAKELGVLPVIKINDVNDAQPLAKALLEGGLPAAEITFRTNCAAEAIQAVKKATPEVLVAAGTVINKEQAQKAMDAGADFLVSPGFDKELVVFCQENNWVIIPGVTTASEAQAAVNLGLEVVKFFPAETSGGIKAISALSAPFDQLTFMPTGGISESNLADYLSNPKIVACGGSWMVKEDLINAGKFDEITQLVKKAVEKIKEIRG